VGYSSRRGRRPDENASKSSHIYVVNDPEVQTFLSGCNLPKKTNDISLSGSSYLPCLAPASNPIKHVIAIDGGYQMVVIDKDFPSSEICFFQFGALIFSISDLESIGSSRFIDPEDMAKLKNIQRLKLTLPVKQITLKSANSLIQSVRQAIFDFFCQSMEDEPLIDTLKWLLFEEYDSPIDQWILASCPNCGNRDIPLRRSSLGVKKMVECDSCNQIIFLTDAFRLHEAVDNELGAGGILGYVTTTIEQLLAAHLIRLILKTKPAVMRQVLFIKDGPLAFFGQTANIHKPMRQLIKHLIDRHDVFLAGLEKSGAFVEHADQLYELMEAGMFLILDDNYIYRYIIPNSGATSNAYGQTTYYGNKIIFKTNSGAMHVVTLPTAAQLSSPTEKDFHNIHAVLSNLEKLRCDMYDNSLIPVALANKLVSLANHPSSRILQKFAVDSLRP
jgi:hypothetical protein